MPQFSPAHRLSNLKPSNFLVSKLRLLACGLVFAFGQLPAQEDGKFPPPKPAEGVWLPLLQGKLTDQWTGMSMAIDSKLISTRPDPDRPGGYILRIDRGPTGLIRSHQAYENYILELEWRHMTEAPSANGGDNTSGNSGLLIAHGPYPNVGGPYPPEGHEVQVCHLGNGSWYTSHGDIFTLPGTSSKAIPDPRFGSSHSCGHRSMPIEYRAKPTGEWNQIRITCVDGVLQQEVNGALVTQLYRISPRKGYISFESEGAPVEFRAMRLQELKPDPELAAKHVAPLLPEPMTGQYVTEKKPTPLPTSGAFIALVDLRATAAASQVFSGLGEIPNAPNLEGRILLERRGDQLTLKAKGLAAEGQPVTSIGPLSLSLDQLKTGHVLILTPFVK